MRVEDVLKIVDVQHSLIVFEQLVIDNGVDAAGHPFRIQNICVLQYRMVPVVQNQPKIMQKTDESFLVLLRRDLMRPADVLIDGVGNKIYLFLPHFCVMMAWGSSVFSRISGGMGRGFSRKSNFLRFVSCSICGGRSVS